MVDVGVAELRRELKHWLEQVAAGDEVIITERGRPVARLSGIDTAPILDRLAAEGKLSPPTADRRTRAATKSRARARGSVSELVVVERDSRR